MATGDDDMAVVRGGVEEGKGAVMNVEVSGLKRRLFEGGVASGQVGEGEDGELVKLADSLVGSLYSRRKLVVMDYMRRNGLDKLLELVEKGVDREDEEGEVEEGEVEEEDEEEEEEEEEEDDFIQQEVEKLDDMVSYLKEVIGLAVEVAWAKALEASNKEKLEVRIRCGGCDKEKLESQMYGASLERKKVNRVCLECDRKIRLKKTKERRQKNIKLVNEVKKEIGKCAICGLCLESSQTSDTTVFDFNHKNPKDKVKEVSQMLTYAREKIMAEIAKCDLLCVACHRVLTFYQGLAKQAGQKGVRLRKKRRRVIKRRGNSMKIMPKNSKYYCLTTENYCKKNIGHGVDGRKIKIYVAIGVKV